MEGIKTGNSLAILRGFTWPFWDGEFPWPFLNGWNGDLQRSGMKRSRIESPGGSEFGNFFDRLQDQHLPVGVPSSTNHGADGEFDTLNWQPFSNMEGPGRLFFLNDFWTWHIFVLMQIYLGGHAYWFKVGEIIITLLRDCEPVGMVFGPQKIYAPASSKWPFDHPNGGHLTPEKVT